MVRFVRDIVDLTIDGVQRESNVRMLKRGKIVLAVLALAGGVLLAIALPQLIINGALLLFGSRTEGEITSVAHRTTTGSNRSTIRFRADTAYRFKLPDGREATGRADREAGGAWLVRTKAGDPITVYYLRPAPWVSSVDDSVGFGLWFGMIFAPMGAFLFWLAARVWRPLRARLRELAAAAQA